jgi:hypothetical protein
MHSERRNSESKPESLIQSKSDLGHSNQGGWTPTGGTLRDDLDALSVGRKDLILVVDFGGKPMSRRGHVSRT